MSASRGASAGSYARAIERRWSQFLERAVVFSAREWALLSDWHARGIPLELVDEAIDELAEPRRRRTRRGPPRSLTAIAPAVEEAWTVVRGDRRPTDPEGRVVEPGSAAAAWEARSRDEPKGSALRGELEDLLRRLERGEEPAELDRRLDGALPRLVSGERLREVEASLRLDLAPFRGTMSEGTFAATLESARAERIRRELGLPRLGFDGLSSRG